MAISNDTEIQPFERAALKPHVQAENSFPVMSSRWIKPLTCCRAPYKEEFEELTLNISYLSSAVVYCLMAYC